MENKLIPNIHYPGYKYPKVEDNNGHFLNFYNIKSRKIIRDFSRLI